MTLDFLFSASQTSLSKPLSRFTGLCDTPIGVYGHSIDGLGAVRTVCVYVAQALSLDISLVDHMGTNSRLLLRVNLTVIGQRRSRVIVVLKMPAVDVRLRVIVGIPRRGAGMMGYRGRWLCQVSGVVYVDIGWWR